MLKTDPALLPQPGYRTMADPDNPHRMWLQPADQSSVLPYDQLWCPHGGFMGYYDPKREVYHFFTLGDVYLEPDDELGKRELEIPQAINTLK